MTCSTDVLLPTALRVVAFGWLAFGAAARAELPPAVVLPTHADGGSDDAVNREVQRAIEQLAVLDLQAQPPLDLEATQLAIDCLDESARCLREVARRSQVQVLIAPTVARADGSIELSILYFDADSGEGPRRVTRRQPGDKLEQATLDAIPDMLRELLRMEPVSKGEPAAPQPAEPTPATARVPPSSGGKLPLGPLLLGAGGLVSLAVGLTLGAVMHGTQNDYAVLPVLTEAQAKTADDQRKAGEREALMANVLIGAGVAAMAVGAIWLAAGLVHEDQPQQARLLPVLGKGQAGLLLSGTWEARL
jgi:hypothetical protein